MDTHRCPQHHLHRSVLRFSPTLRLLCYLLKKENFFFEKVLRKFKFSWKSSIKDYELLSLSFTVMMLPY